MWTWTTACTVVVFLAFLLNGVQGSEPGFKVRLTQHILRLLEDFCKKSLKDVFKKESVQKMDGEMGEVDFHLYDLKVADYDQRFTANFTFREHEGVAIDIKDLTIRIKSPYKVELWVFYNTGTVTVDLYRMRVQALLGAEVDKGRLRPKLQYCQTDIPVVSVQFHGGMINQIMNMFEDRIAQAVKTRLRMELCSYLSDTFTSKLQKAFFEVPLSTILFDNYYLNYTLLDSPKIHNSYAETVHSGEVYAKYRNKTANATAHWVEDHSAPYKPPPLPQLAHIEQMVYMYVSDYLLNNLLYYLHRQGAFDFKFTTKEMPDEFKGYLQTTCDFGLCAGLLFPTLAEQYPDSTIEVFAKLTVPPVAVIQDGHVNVTSHVNFTGYVRRANAFQADFLFTGLVDTVAFLQRFLLLNSTLSGDIAFHSVTLHDIRSIFEEIDQTSLDLVFSFALENFIEADLKAILSKGIELPQTGPFILYNSTVWCQPEVIILATDFQLNDN